MEGLIRTLSEKYGLDTDFLRQLEGKIIDKENFARAVRMFRSGLMKYETASGKEEINVAELRGKVARDLWKARRIRWEKIGEMRRKTAEYYSACTVLTLCWKGKDERFRKEAVYLKDGVIVAFACPARGRLGIYSAHNDMVQNYNWHPHDALARLRSINNAFYRKVKKAAFASPRVWFDFNRR